LRIIDDPASESFTYFAIGIAPPYSLNKPMSIFLVPVFTKNFALEKELEGYFSLP
jgi:hypothetical protein